MKSGVNQSPDFQKVFESLAGNHLLLTPDFIILGMSDDYLINSQRARAELVGISVFEAFPDNPDDATANGVARLRASLERVVATGQADTMPLQKYDIPRPASEGGGFAERWWKPFNSPVLDSEGRVIQIIHSAENVTDRVRLARLEADALELRHRQAIQALSGGGEMGGLIRAKDWSRTPVGPVEAWPQSLRTAVSLLLDNKFGMMIAWGDDGTQFYNDAFRPILGATKHPAALGQPAAATYAESWQIVDPLFARVRAGEAVSFEDLLVPLHRNGYLEDCYFTFSYSPIRDESGGVGGILVTVIETSARVLAERATDQHRRQAETAREELRLITDRLPALISYMSADRRYKFVNEAYSRWFKLPRDKIEGRTRQQLVSNDTTYEYMRPFEARAFAGEAVSFELKLTKPDGEYVDLDTEYLPDRDPATGEVRGIIGVGHDVTWRNQALREAQLAREELQGVFTQAALPMCILSGPRHVFTLANPLYVRFVGREVVGKALSEVFTDAEVGTFIPLLDEVYRTGTPLHIHEAPLTLTNAQGLREERVIDVGYHPFRAPDGTPQGVLVVVLDVTESVRAREKVEQLAAELRDSVHSRDEFMSIASHELKTPITSLKLQLQMTRRRIRPESGEAPPATKLAEVFDASARQVDRLTDLVETLLDMSRIRAGRIEYSFAPFNLRETIDDVVDRFGDQLSEADSSIAIDASASLPVTWDRFRIEQVLVNLLSNAIKYAPGRPIRIQARQQGDVVSLTVRDSGPGIPRDRQGRIFERFERATASRNISGLGLGLFIADQIVKGHHGTIRVESAPGEGAEFVVEIPIRPVPPAA